MTRKNLCLPILIAAGMSLSACGGSSGSSSPPVTNPPAAETVTVRGFVTDMPIPNATVIITVDGQEFTAPNPTDADGGFEVEIETTDTDALVECVAFDPDGPARFSALLNSFAGLQEDAGDDGVAEDVNVTNVTTAQFLLAQELATDGSIDSLDELQDIAGQIDPDELLELSAAIKIVVDSVQGVTLPDGFDDVQELAQAIVDGDTTFLEDIEATNPGILDETIDEVLNDGFATVPFTADTAPGVYINTNGFDLLALYEDGTGYNAEEEEAGQFLEEVTWSVTDTGALEVVFTEAQDVDTFVLLNEAGNVMTLHRSTVEGDVEIEPITLSAVHLGFDPDGFDPTTVPGSYNDPEDPEEETEFTVFLDDGSGYDIDAANGVQDDFFTWEVNDAGELIMIDDGMADNGEAELSDERLTAWLLEGSTADTRNVLSVEFEFDGDAAIELEALPLDYTSDIVTGPMPDVANTMLLEGKTYGFSDGVETILATFGSDGAYSEIYQDFDEQSGPQFGEDEAEWFVDDVGTIRIIFPEDELGEAETMVLTLVSGLGESQMILSEVDDSGVAVELVLDQVVPFDADDNIAGTWEIMEDGQVQTETVTFNANGTGSYFDDGMNDGDFDWIVNGDGKLMLTLAEEPGDTGVFTDNFHKLADSTVDNLHLMLVFRFDGELDNDAEDLQGPAEVIIEVNFVRQP